MKKSKHNFVYLLVIGIVITVVIIISLWIYFLAFENVQGFENRLNGEWHSEEGEIFYFDAYSPTSFGYRNETGDIWNTGCYEIKGKKMICSYHIENSDKYITKTYAFSFSNNDTILTLIELETERVIIAYKVS